MGVAPAGSGLRPRSSAGNPAASRDARRDQTKHTRTYIRVRDRCPNEFHCSHRRGNTPLAIRSLVRPVIAERARAWTIGAIIQLSVNKPVFNMGPTWLALGCLCLLATLAQCAPPPTQDTMVVARSDDGITEATAETTPAPEATSEEPLAPIKLTEMDVRSEVAMRYAHTAVVTRVRNPAKRAQEANFRVLLPETAFISGFTMTLDGKSYKAYVKEKEEAKQIYNDAVSQGIGAAHIAAKARDSNHFTVSVNVEPNTTAVFNLTYEELLVRRNHVYNHDINLHPGALVPKLTVTVHVREAQKITQLRVPEIRTGNEIDPTADDAQNSLAVVEKSADGKEATITFSPNLDEQRRLMEVYADKTKESQSHVSRPWYYEQQNEAKPEGVLGQFVVQYDVERPKDGEILVNDGYFAYFFAPSDLPPLNKHVVFVLDTSGSMLDRKIIQLREAMQTILGELNTGDYFSIVGFASSVKVYDLKEADKEEPPPRRYYYEEYNGPLKLLPPSPVTPENIAKAKIIVSRLQASGGTNIGQALDVAVDLIRKGVGWTEEPATSSTMPTPVKPVPEESNQEASTNQEAANQDTVKQESSTTQEVSTPQNEKDKQLEPIIIFLTDGDPTVGETNPTRIVSHLSEKNYGEKKASIFSLAFGEDADRKLLRKISLLNDGFMRHIYEAADAAQQLRDFYRQVSSPLLADVKFVYPPEQIKEGSLTKHKFRTFYAGSEAVVAGRIADDVTELTPRIVAVCGVDSEFVRKQYEIFPRIPVEKKKKKNYLPLERLWAYLNIKQLLDERDAAEAQDKKVENKEDSPEKKALAIALKYEFVTPLTSLVVVKPNATKAVDAESVDKKDQYPSFPSAGFPLAANNFAWIPPNGALGAPGAPSASGGYASYSGPPPAAFGAQSSQPIYNSAQFSFSNSPVYEDAAEEDLMSYDRGDIDVSTPAPLLFDALDSVVTTAKPDPLATYHLTDYPWVSSILSPNSNTLNLQLPADGQRNATTVTLEVTSDADAPKESSDMECSPNAAAGEEHLCVYLTRCDSAKNITVEQYAVSFCTINTKYAGVCCPRSEVDVVH